MSIYRKTALSSLWLLLISSVISGGCLAPPWKDITFGDTGFESSMPAMPRSFDKDYPSAYGKLKVRFKVLTYKYATFTMSVTDFPDEYVKSSNLDSILVAARDSAINEVDGTLIDEKAVVVSTLPGREIRYSFGEGKARRIALARIYLGGTRLFQLHAAVLESGKYKKDAKRFIESVKITKEYKAVAQTTAQWKEMVSRDGKFKVLTVGTPFLKDKTEDGRNSPCYFFNSGGSAYALSWSDISDSGAGTQASGADTKGSETNVNGVSLPNSTGKAVLPDKGSDFEHGKTMVEESVKATLARFRAKPFNVKELSGDGFTGKSFSFNTGAGYVSRCRVIVSKEKLYQLVVTSPVSLKDTSTIEIFLKSFQVLD